MSSLFSPSWYRVADLRPRLRSQARLSRHIYRGERWHVLQDRGSGRFIRLNPQAYRIVALMDGLRTLDEIWRQACLVQGDEAPSQDEVVNLLGQLNNANVLISDKHPDFAELHERSTKTRRQQLKQYIANPMSLKIPLINPDQFLERLVQLVPPSSWRLLLAAWVLFIGFGAFGVAYYWQDLTHDLASRSFTAENVLTLALIFPLLKVVHEFGHGIAIKALGGACREMGVMLLVFMPVPYMDAGQATAFPNKWHRMLVGAAGMMAELVMATTALWLWSWAEPGMTKSVLHQAVILSGVTTLVFNINPLLRFDGYYILADWLEIPNLGTRANQYLGYLLSRYAFSSEKAERPPLTPREGGWLLFYAIASFVYRISVSLGIIFFVAGSFFFFGVILALWSGWNMLIGPLSRQVQLLAMHPALEGRRAHAAIISGGMIALLGAILVWVPAPSWTTAEGVIWMTEDARVRVSHPCFAKSVLVQAGSQVKVGDALLECSDPDLDAQIAQAKSRLQELEARFSLAVSSDRVQMQMVQADLIHARDVLDDLTKRLSALTFTSPHDGIFYMDAPGDFAGRHLVRGEAIAYVLDPAKITLITVVPQGDVDLVRQNTRSVELRVIDDIWTQIRATIKREVPAATKELPSMALSLAGGGKIGLDPESSATGEPAALTPLFQFELALPAEYRIRTLGSRVHVRFIHANEPLASQWYRAIRQVFLKRFAV